MLQVTSALKHILYIYIYIHKDPCRMDEKRSKGKGDIEEIIKSYEMMRHVRVIE